MNNQLPEYLIVVPSYNPPDTFPSFVQQVKSLGFSHILVINDGSVLNQSIFNKVKSLDVPVIEYSQNQGKGHALKTGFRWILDRNLSQVKFIMTCDDDGQHSIEDLLRMAQSFDAKTEVMLGHRDFTVDVPMKSYIGNLFMRSLFFILTGKALKDTQTGLRCFNQSLLPQLLKIEAAGFDYESISLLQLLISGRQVRELPIKTIYFKNNQNTRFHSLKDSARVILRLIGFWLKARLKSTSH